MVSIANRGGDMRSPSVSTVPVQESQEYEWLNWVNLGGALLLPTEPEIPPQQGAPDEQAKCFLGVS